ncbi:unnamed protein product (macronuclear) [Paramecium tetraurelia]|uniref:Transmembrane protein n=1 Tax=Paramecium tetraurelia TaxID=5888 RepID=A0DIZ6_PARTE|nr:uncharacterized protein GSPATT00017370001 [Paramecium tetraurelia]CAK83013.1 unnamed protein product [Paramecium tetraurelia]|eukprot:XP_001450410.1 hypothetical protein (macronuclear) [Paramecium tetraurelia strain d4-2]
MDYEEDQKEFKQEYGMTLEEQQQLAESLINEQSQAYAEYNELLQNQNEQIQWYIFIINNNNQNKNSKIEIGFFSLFLMLNFNMFIFGSICTINQVQNQYPQVFRQCQQT